jgi:hypothetical protein
MHARRLASFFLGIWLAGSLFMAWVSAENLNEVDRLLSGQNPIARRNLQPLGAQGAAILRYTAAEQIRWYHARWETIQIIGGSALLLLMLFGSREDKFILLGIALPILVVCVERFFITREMTDLGRLLDFPQAQQPAEAGRYGVVETAYYVAETAKGVLILVLAGLMVFSTKGSGRSRDVRHKLDGVDKPNHRRVYR